MNLDWFGLTVNLLVGILAAVFGVVSTLFLTNHQNNKKKAALIVAYYAEYNITLSYLISYLRQLDDEFIRPEREDRGGLTLFDLKYIKQLSITLASYGHVIPENQRDLLIRIERQVTSLTEADLKRATLIDTSTNGKFKIPIIDTARLIYQVSDLIRNISEFITHKDRYDINDSKYIGKGGTLLLAYKVAELELSKITKSKIISYNS